MVQIAIVEDSPQDRKRIRDYLLTYEKEHEVRFGITEFADGEDILSGYSASWDIIFMDIEMAFLNGMETSKRVRKFDLVTEIIFTTNLPQYAIEGYEVAALDYLIKPFSYSSFKETLERAVKLVVSKRGEKNDITVSTKAGDLRLHADKLYYVEILNHTLLYHSSVGNFSGSGTLGQVRKALDPFSFFLCSRSYLVNLDHVEYCYDNVAKVHGDLVQVSRSRKKAFLDALNKHINSVSI